MSTFLFNDIVFGPVASRRLGVSLGLNILSNSCKVCNFNCVYCECGWTQKPKGDIFPSRELVATNLRKVLLQMRDESKLPDVITFAGNGEPTMHPQFTEIIDDTISIRNEIAPKVKIAVLSNATLLNKVSVMNALRKVDMNILKLDSGFEETIKMINKPVGNFSLSKLYEGLQQFNNVIIQTLFLTGMVEGKKVDNTSTIEIEKWLDALQSISPKLVMIYTIARDTPLENLKKVNSNTLHEIAAKVKALGIEVSVTE